MCFFSPKTPRTKESCGSIKIIISFIFSEIVENKFEEKKQRKERALHQKLLPVQIKLLLISRFLYSSVVLLYIGNFIICGVKGKNGYGGTAAQGE